MYLLLVETNNVNEGQNGKTPTMNNTHLQVPEEGKLLSNKKINKNIFKHVVYLQLTLLKR